MAKTAFLFDLDGTLSDPKVGITTAVATALHQFGIQADPDSLTDFIGPPLLKSFMEKYGFSEAQAEQAIVEYRVYYQDRGWKENILYPGIPGLLQSLKTAGAILLVASSKPEVTVVRILQHFEIDGYFDVIAGPALSDHHSTKAKVIADALKRGGVMPENAVMVGDRCHDVAGGRENGLPTVGVTYGYGSREELETAGACRAVDTVEELKATLLSLIHSD